jgi:hypothetical protein
MIHEAEVFLMADEAVLQAFGWMRPEHYETVLPPVFDMPGADQPTPVRQLLAHVAYDEAWIPDVLAGRTMDEGVYRAQVPVPDDAPWRDRFLALTGRRP